MHRISSNHAEWSEKFLRASLLIRLIYGGTQEEHKRTNGEILQRGSTKKLTKIEERKRNRQRRMDQSEDRKRAKMHFLEEKNKKNLHPGVSNYNFQFHRSTDLDHFILFCFMSNCSIESRTQHHKAQFVV